MCMLPYTNNALIVVLMRNIYCSIMKQVFYMFQIIKLKESR